MASNNSKIVKIKRMRFSLKQKAKIIEILESGKAVSEVSREFGCDESTLYKIKKQREQIKLKLAESPEPFEKKRSFKGAKYPELEDQLFKWFVAKRKENSIITSIMMSNKARILFEKLYPTVDANKFDASKGWLRNFRVRHQIRYLKVTGEKASVDYSGIEPFLDKLEKVINEMGIGESQIYNADESGLYYLTLPTKTLVSSSEKVAAGHKINKKRLTFMPCCNLDGSNRLPLLCLGTAERPRCFTKTEMKQLPVSYKKTKKGWQTKEVFYNWFHEEFVQSVRQFSQENGIEAKALLVLDNAPSHFEGMELISDDGQIRVLYLPPNCTAELQPMDQNIIYNIKRRYLKSLFIHILSKSDESGSTLEEETKNINLKHVFDWLAVAWSEISESLIRSSWKKLLSIDTNDGIEKITNPIIISCIKYGDSQQEVNSEQENMRKIILSVNAKYNLQIDEEGMNEFLNENIGIYEPFDYEKPVTSDEETENESENEESAPENTPLRQITHDKCLKNLEEVSLLMNSRNFSQNDRINLLKLKECIFTDKINSYLL